MANRDERGRFIKGNKAAVGNRGGRPRRSTEEKYLGVLIGATSISDWKDIIGRAIKDAKDGDKDARKWLADYLIGKPTQYVDADIKGGDLQIKVIEVAAPKDDAE